ncbi:MAG: hypothetical protein ACQKBY_04835, partial [Verrucomicrobiales bacterium]
GTAAPEGVEALRGLAEGEMPVVVSDMPLGAWAALLEGRREVLAVEVERYAYGKKGLRVGAAVEGAEI